MDKNESSLKKTSFVWLLSNDPLRLSADRLERVKDNTKFKMKSKKKFPVFDYIKKRRIKIRKKEQINKFKLTENINYMYEVTISHFYCLFVYLFNIISDFIWLQCIVQIDLFLY